MDVLPSLSLQVEDSFNLMARIAVDITRWAMI